MISSLFIHFIHSLHPAIIGPLTVLCTDIVLWSLTVICFLHYGNKINLILLSTITVLSVLLFPNHLNKIAQFNKDNDYKAIDISIFRNTNFNISDWKNPSGMYTHYSDDVLIDNIYSTIVGARMPVSSRNKDNLSCMRIPKTILQNSKEELCAFIKP